MKRFAATSTAFRVTSCFNFLAPSCKLGWAAVPAPCFHRARRGHALLCPEKRSRCPDEHRYYPRVRETARRIGNQRGPGAPTGTGGDAISRARIGHRRLDRRDQNAEKAAGCSKETDRFYDG